jgi:hypothetical protein
VRVPPSVATVRFVVTASALVTLFHFIDNAVSIDTYPDPEPSPALILVSWALFTAIGVAGLELYRRERIGAAHLFLLAYSFAGLSSLAHFFSGSPETTRGIVSVLIDGAAGTSVLAVTLWSVRARRRAPGDVSFG